MPKAQRHARIDTHCPSCQKPLAIILTKQDVKDLLKQIKTGKGGIPRKGKDILVGT